MCRLFGFLSSRKDTVHSSLLTERNSLRVQSREHPDGWGIAYYPPHGDPTVAHGVGAAHSDPEFERVSQFVTSHAVVAHVRLASVGGVHLKNAHPFVHGRWSFAHNGTLRNFATRHQKRFEEQLAPKYRGKFRGETDSERCFYLFLTRLEQVHGSLEAPPLETVARVLSWTAEYATRTTDDPDDKPSSANFMVTDGELMVCTRINRSLYFSEKKRKATEGGRPETGSRLDQLVDRERGALR